MGAPGAALAPALCFSADSMVAAPARSAWAGGGHRGLNGEGTMARGQVQAGGTQDKALGRCVAKAAAGAAAPPALPGEGEAKPEHRES